MERRQIVDFWGAQRAGLLVTLVRAEGSSYRRPGARLLVGTGGGGGDAETIAASTGDTGAGYAGTISGGCLEAEVVKRAAWKVREGAVVERYSMAFDDTAEIPFGLGCGGTVDLLFERADLPEGVAMLEALRASLGGQRCRVVTFLPGGGRGLRRLVLDEAGGVVFASAGLSGEKIGCAQGLDPGVEYEGRFVEALEPPQRLVVLGAGDDAKPLVRLAGLMGWSVAVGDGRGQLARAERFPGAEVRVLEGGRGLEMEAADAVVLMTHSYEQDRELLVRVLPLGVRYVGLLGSRHRSSLLVSEAAAMLGRTVEACCERLFAPIGMNLGGDGPEAIALAIVAEVQAVCEGKVAVRPRLTPEEIARQLARGGTSRYLNTTCALDAR